MDEIKSGYVIGSYGSDCRCGGWFCGSLMKF